MRLFGPITPTQHNRRRRQRSLWAALGPAAVVQRLRKARRQTTRAAVIEASPAPPKVVDTRLPRGLDLLLLGSVGLLVCLGTVMIYSSSAVYAASKYGNGTYFLSRQLVYVVLGIGALYVGWRIDYRWYQRLVLPVLGITLLLLAALLVPGVGTRVDGATRWFRIGGVSFQPSELAKLALTIYLAYSLARKRSQLKIFTIGFLPHLGVACLLAALVLKQPDLGNAVILVAVALLLLFVAGTRLSYIMISVLVAAPIAYQQIVGTPWRLRRLIVFLDPWAYRQDAGYQVSESLLSVGSGGMWGLGLGAGKSKLFFLPAAHTDFIFAVSGEELGFIGLVGIVVLFTIVVIRGIRAALGATDLFGTYLSFGITATLGLQAALHMAVVLGMVPTKGITLPLLSYGGSSLLINLFSVGILLNIGARNLVPCAETRSHLGRLRAHNRKRAPRVQVLDG